MYIDAEIEELYNCTVCAASPLTGQEDDGCNDVMRTLRHLPRRLHHRDY